MPNDFDTRLQQRGDRAAISERVITYAVSIDRADWPLFESGFTDPVHVDLSEARMPARDFPRAAFVGIARAGLGGFTARRHLGRTRPRRPPPASGATSRGLTKPNRPRVASGRPAGGCYRAPECSSTKRRIWGRATWVSPVAG